MLLHDIITLPNEQSNRGAFVFPSPTLIWIERPSQEDLRPCCLFGNGGNFVEGVLFMESNGTREEIWKNIPRHEGYKVSNLGRIWSSKTKKVLRPVSWEGYKYIFLYDGKGNSVKMRVHRAVLLAFVGEPLSNQESRHLNGSRGDNRLENLAWGTRLENVRDRQRHGKAPIPHESKFTKLIPEDIPIIRRLQGLHSSREVALMFGTSHATIQKIWRRERWKGY